MTYQKGLSNLAFKISNLFKNKHVSTLTRLKKLLKQMYSLLAIKFYYNLHAESCAHNVGKPVFTNPVSE